MKRLELVRNSELYRTARQLPKTKKKERSDAFKKAREQYRYSEYDLHSFASSTSKAARWIAEKVDSTAQQKIATRAFKASERVILGMAKQVRYKVPSRFRSMEGKSNKTGIRWKDDCLVWGKLVLKPIIDPTNPVIRHGLESPVKYVRLLWRVLNGKRRWYAQLVNEGAPYQKPQNYVSDGLVGLDLNVSNIAYAGDHHAGLLPFAEKVPTFQREITALQKKMQRSQRANNPENFEPNFKAKKGRKAVVKKGKVKKGDALGQRNERNPNNNTINRDASRSAQEGEGIPTGKMSQPYNNEYSSSPTDQPTKAGSFSLSQCKAHFSSHSPGKAQWKKTSNYLKAASKKRELERRKTAYAKTQNRRVVNEILKQGKHIKTENVSVKGWQKIYGKAISAKSPGFVQSELKRKAEGAGGSFTKFSTQKTALSQTHLDGTRIKKSLSQRVHRDVTGLRDHHRDLFSAFLSRSVNQDKLILQDAQDEYLRLEPTLLEAYQRYLTREQVGKSESTQSDSPSERVSNESLTTDQIARTVSPALREGFPPQATGEPEGAKSQMGMWRESPHLQVGEGSKHENSNRL